MIQPVIFVLVNRLPQDVLHVDRAVVLASPAAGWTFVLTHHTHLSGMVEVQLEEPDKSPLRNIVFHKPGKPRKSTHIFGMSMQEGE